MNSLADLSGFASRLREFIRAATPTSARIAEFARPIAGLNARSTTEAEFDRHALELFALQFEHNAPYRRFCEARGARPDSLTHWSQIPAIPTSAFKELELSCLPPGERTRVFHSSGTTAQQPSRHFHNAESLALYEASLWPWFEAQVLGSTAASDESLLCLVPSAADAPRSSLAHMFETVRNKMGADASTFLGRIDRDGGWAVDLEETLAALRRAGAKGKPILLMGTAFSIVHLLDFLVERKVRLEVPPGSRAMETGGYKGRSRALSKSELHSLLTRQLGIPPAQIVSEYGMSELSSQAYDVVVSKLSPLSRTMSAPHDLSHTTRSFRFPPWARARIISPETGRESDFGETGLIRIFDLANVYSVMAIQTEDLGVRREEGFELIGRAALAESRGCSLMAV